MFLGFVHAIDPDIVGTPELHYKLLSDTFSISPLSGEVRVIRALDREEKNRYKLKVIAVDGGGRTGKSDVIVYVVDVNDNEPVFEKLFYNISVHVNFPIGGVVGYVSATDADEGRNAQVMYSSPTAQGNLVFLYPATLCPACWTVLCVGPQR